MQVIDTVKGWNVKAQDIILVGIGLRLMLLQHIVRHSLQIEQQGGVQIENTWYELFVNDQGMKWGTRMDISKG